MEKSKLSRKKRGGKKHDIKKRFKGRFKSKAHAEDALRMALLMMEAKR